MAGTMWMWACIFVVQGCIWVAAYFAGFYMGKSVAYKFCAQQLHELKEEVEELFERQRQEDKRGKKNGR